MRKFFIAYLIFLLFLAYGFFTYLGGLKVNSWRIQTSESYFKKGEEELRENNYEKAFLDFQKAETLKPFSQDIQLEIGDLYYSLGFFDSAKKYYLNTNSFKGYAKLSRCYFEEKDYDQAINYAKKSLEIEKNQEAFHSLGLSFMAQEKFNEARSIFKETISFDNNDNRSHYYLSLILALEDLGSAEKEISLIKNDSDIEDFLKILTEVKNHSNPYFQKVSLANFYIEKKFYSLSKHLLNQVIQEKNNYRDAYFLLGRTYFLDEDYQKAKEIFKKVIEIDPICREGYLSLVEVYKKLGDSENSEKYLQKANDLNL